MAATTDRQIALTGAQRGSSSHLNRPARQLVPAFLQKLYEMVNDPTNQDLIRWSDTGDSFFVLDQERFSGEVLGRWFKHNRFSSFVRQLNMYGFHKIPHLQQGVLRADSDTEFWNFEHPHFLRGQPDMLCLIQRKKPAGGEDGHHGHHGHAGVPAVAKDAAAAGGTVGALSANQLMDINSIVNGIQVIKRHQAAISADLNELKGSNQYLWQEAMAARERHKKHQDTINRILKFLAGVVGHGENQMRKDEDASHAMVARKPQRLLIAGGQKTNGIGVAEEASRSSMDGTRSTHSTASMDTPAQSSESFAMPRFASVEPSATDAPTPVATESRPIPQPAPASLPENSTNSASSATPASATLPPSSQPNNDHIVQAALTSVLNSPTQMQKLLTALASQSIGPEVFSSTAPPHLIAPSPYNPPSHTPITNPASTDSQPSTAAPPRLPPQFDYSSSNAPSPFTLSLLGAPSEPEPLALQQQDERLQRNYKSTVEINNDVDELQSNIQSLIQSLGIDPTALDGVVPASEPSATGVVDGANSASLPTGGDMDMFPPGSGQDFDFDSFLMDMPRANEDDGDLDTLAERLDPSAASKVSVSVSDTPQMGNASSSSEQLHALLDGVAASDGPALHGAFTVPEGASTVNGSVVPGAGVGAGAAGGVGTRGRKRKSDVIVDETQTHGPTQAPASSATGNKSKRKR